MSFDYSKIKMCAADLHNAPFSDSKKARAVSYKGLIWPERSIIYINFETVPLDIDIEESEFIINPIDSFAYDPLEKICCDRIRAAKLTKDQNTVQIAVEDSIKEIVMKRFQPYINLTFVFGPGNSNINISFSKTGAWSVIGRNSNYAKPSMNFGSFSVRIVLHEFGHALGLGHEHQSPINNSIKWNLEEVYKWAKGWSQEQVYYNIIKRLETTEINDISYFKPGTVDPTLVEYDPSSIMLYFYPPEVTLDNKGTALNLILSKKDVLYLNALYPGDGANGSTRISPYQFYLDVYKKNIYYDVIKFIIKTSSDIFAGTYSDVIVSLYDPNLKKARDFKLENDFKTGKTGTYILQSTGIPRSSLINKPILFTLKGKDRWKFQNIAIYYNDQFIISYYVDMWLGDGKSILLSTPLPSTTNDNQCAVKFNPNLLNVNLFNDPPCVAFDKSTNPTVLLNGATCKYYKGKCYSTTANQCTNSSDCKFSFRDLRCVNTKGGSSLNCRLGLKGCTCVSGKGANNLKENFQIGNVSISGLTIGLIVFWFSLLAVLIFLSIQN